MSISQSRLNPSSLLCFLKGGLLSPHRKPKSSVSFEVGAWMALCQSPGRGWNQDPPAHLAGIPCRGPDPCWGMAGISSRRMWFGEELLTQSLGAFPIPPALSLGIPNMAGLGGHPSPGGGVCMKRCASVLGSYICSPHVLSILLQPALSPRKLNGMDWINRLPSHPSSPRLLAGRFHGGLL